jgi:glycosyltransferase involved in cell wall biosynthesis
MRILYITTYSPWPTVSGGAWRSFRVLERLATDNALVVALCTDLPVFREPFLAADPLALPRRVLEAPGAVQAPDGASDRTLRLEYTPFALRQRWRRAFLATCDEVEPDLVWFSELSAIWRCGPFDAVPVVTDMVDVQAVKEARAQAAELGVAAAELEPGLVHKDLLRQRDLRRRYLLRRSLLGVPGARLADPGTFRRRRSEATVLQVALAERSAARASNTVLLANHEDAPYLDALAPTMIVPNGFDFRRGPAPSADGDGRTLVFLGLLTYRPNIDGLRWFCDQVWPLIRAEAPAARLEIVGKHDEQLSFAFGVPGATVHGFVPDLTEIANRSSALVVPLLAGGGTRIKILEAWARRLPVVSTSIGCEGLGAQDGVTLLVADDPGGFAERCVRLLGDAALRHRLAQEGFEHGRRSYDWGAVLAGLESALEVARADFSRKTERQRQWQRQRYGRGTTTRARVGPEP